MCRAFSVQPGQDRWGVVIVCEEFLLLLVNGALLVNQGYFCQVEHCILSVSLFSVNMSLSL